MIRTASLFFLFSILAWPLSAGTLKLGGSDLMQSMFEEAREPLFKEANLSVELSLAGSVHAMDDLRKGRLDCAVVAIPERSPMPGPEFDVYPLAHLIGTVITHADNPVPELTFEQLRQLYSAESESLANWGELGLGGEWRGRTIQVLALKRDASMSLDLFRYSVMPGQDLSSNVVLVSDRNELLARMQQERNAVGLVDGPIHSDKLRMLPVAGASDGISTYAFDPTAENIAYGDYPLRLKFLVLVSSDATSDVRDLVRVLLSEKMSDLLARHRFIAQPERERKRLLLELDSKP